MEMFGPDFEKFDAQEEAAHPHPHSTPTTTEDDPTTNRVDKAKKGKIAAKATGLQYQFQIMESMGIPREEIKNFADPYFWLKYFPPICMVYALCLLHCTVLTVSVGGQQRIRFAHRLAPLLHHD